MMKIEKPSFLSPNSPRALKLDPNTALQPAAHLPLLIILPVSILAKDDRLMFCQRFLFMT